MNAWVCDDEDDDEFINRQIGGGHENVPSVQVHLPRRYPGEESGYYYGDDGRSDYDSDDSLNRRIRSRNPHVEAFPRESSPLYGEHGRDSSPFDRGRPRVINPGRGYYSRDGSWERIRGRSESLPRNRPYFGGDHHQEYGYGAYYGPGSGMDRF